MRLTALIVAALPLAAHAQTAPDEPNAQGDVSVTIYNNDLALVQDKRTLTLSTGRNRQEFADVSARIRPETVTLSAEDAGIVEQNFDYDLLSPQKLMDKAVGQSVSLVRTNPATGAETRETAQVLANNGGTIVRVGDRIEVLSGMNARVVFAKLPPNLRARPTLSVTLDATRGGARPATLSYLSNGFGWKADYVTLFDEAAGKIDVQGWITLNNTSGTSFPNARTLLVAGAPGGQVNSSPRFQPRNPSGNRPGTESANRERLGDYYVYPIAGRTTLANAQQKQVSFLDVSGAPAAKAYYFRNDWLSSLNEAASVDTVLRFSSSRAGGLGDALPAGTVRVYMRDARGQPQFIGENNIPHTPMGSDLALKTGEAFDVKIQPTVEKRAQIDSNEWARSERYRITDRNGQTSEVTVDRAVTYWRTTMRYRVTNARPTPVMVEVVQGGLDHWWWHDSRVPNESIKGTQRSQDERVWLVSVPANGETNLTVDFDTRY
ncbi:DUF4139 domain-containing protein [Sphingomonas sp. LM7]|uniref:DUF4139 domain-containing protein n=1 Tax=Sphingomonas sp. LM7 TaxID=1938607 RepID=UPI000983E92C|nr:DUF4139 domain-containing protein [Sphingomonas sp. LM7]AQR75328.1 DUF4139 domain-containing protein [Sphingomonas sp. LM7]